MLIDDRKRVIGKVVSVAADRLTIELLSGTDNFNVSGYDDVHYIAQIGSYVMIPIQTDYIVAEIIGLREREISQPHSNPKEQELSKIEAAKYLDVVPVGTLPRKDKPFKFGVSVYPSLYADVLYVRNDELDRIFSVGKSISELPIEGVENKTRLVALNIGRSVVFHDYALKIAVDQFFGGHVAVLGNTGSGKSCTISAILQSLYEKAGYAAHGSTFIIFDVNGEYKQAMGELPEDVHVRYINFNGEDDGEKFSLPHWFLNIDECELLLKASERTQLPILRNGLGLATLFSSSQSAELREIKNHILASCIDHILRDESGSPSKHDRIVSILNRYNTEDISSAIVEPLIRISYGQMANPERLSAFLNGTGAQDEGEEMPGFIKPGLKLPDYNNAPFEFDALGDAIDLAILYEEAHGNRQIRDYCSQLLTRFKTLQHREDFKFLRDTEEERDTTDKYVDWLLGLVCPALR